MIARISKNDMLDLVLWCHLQIVQQVSDGWNTYWKQKFKKLKDVNKAQNNNKYIPEFLERSISGDKDGFIYTKNWNKILIEGQNIQNVAVGSIQERISEEDLSEINRIMKKYKDIQTQFSPSMALFKNAMVSCKSSPESEQEIRFQDQEFTSQHIQVDLEKLSDAQRYGNSNSSKDEGHREYHINVLGSANVESANGSEVMPQMVVTRAVGDSRVNSSETDKYTRYVNGITKVVARLMKLSKEFKWLWKRT